MRERASLQPDDVAFTYIDYDHEWEGVEESLTWSQLYRRVLNLADQLLQNASPGDRAVILAPQGLDYIVSFLASLQAGIIAVPLSVPGGGAHDERTISVMADTSPTIVLTASSIVDNVAEYAQPQPGGKAPAIVEVDLLDLDSRQRSRGSGSRAAANDRPDILYLQYTSGSTRTPAGVSISNRNLFANFEQIMTAYYGVYGKVAPAGSTVVSWLPFYHDMGFFLGMILPVLAGIPAKLTSPIGFLQRPARWMQMLASNTLAFSAAPNFAYDIASRKTSDEDMAGFDLGNVHGILNGIDDNVWNPATDKLIPHRFFRGRLAQRSGNKTMLQRRLGLTESPDALLIGVVSRLTLQKGLDMLLGEIADLVADGVQVAILGAGDRTLEYAFIEAAARNPGSIGCVIGYNEPLAHLIQAGGDALLVPSRFEPCGLTQLCALRYGAIPVVSRVGGLADSVIDANEAALTAGVATGIQFSPATPEALEEALRRLMALWRNRPVWQRMQRNAMAAEVSWRGPAAHYAALYDSLQAERA